MISPIAIGYTSQPPTIANLNPFYKNGCFFAFHASSGTNTVVFDVGNRGNFAAVSNATRTLQAKGYGLTQPTGNANCWNRTDIVASTLSSGDYTLIFLTKPGVVTNTEVLFAGANTANAWFGKASSLWSFNGGGGGPTVTGGWQVVGVRKAGAVFEIFADGVFATATTAAFGSASTTIGAFGNGDTTFNWTGNTPCGAAWTYAMDRSQIINLTKNIWQLFAMPRKQYPFAPTTASSFLAAWALGSNASVIGSGIHA